MNTFTPHKQAVVLLRVDGQLVSPAQVFDRLLDTTESITWDFDL